MENKNRVVIPKQRRNTLEFLGLDLTDEEMASGYHFCYEWDGMIVGPDMNEWYAGEHRSVTPCLCGHKHPEQDNEKV